MGSTFFSNLVTTTILTCLLMRYLNAAPVCNFNKLKYNEVGLGLCGSNGYVTLWHCPSCHPGHGQLEECGRRYPEGTKVGCVECIANHTYSDTYDISQCKQCTRCQENEVQSGQCTRENDIIRCTCKRGYYRDRGHCKPCSWCCWDKTNEKVPECNIPQVPMAKQCSLQTAKNCAPTTPAPSTISTTTVIAPITSPMTAFTTEQTSSKESKNRSNSININTNDPESTTKDSKKTDKEHSGGKDSGESTFSQNNTWITGIVVVVIILLVLLATFCCCKRSSNSSNGDSIELNSSSTSNASSPGNSSDGDSAPLLDKKRDVNSNKSGEHVDLKLSDSSATSHAKSKALESPKLQNSEEKQSVLTYQGSCFQGSSAVSDSLCSNHSVDVSSLSKEQQLDLKVTSLPLEILSKVCARLDAEDPFFRDYRMFAEQLGVENEAIGNLAQTESKPTQSLLNEYELRIKEFLKILKAIEREDVMEVIEKWLNHDSKKSESPLEA